MLNMKYHIGLIPDGNRRWARERGLEFWEGHREGAGKTELFIEWFIDHEDISEVTFYGLSEENFKRSAEELEKLYKLYEDEFTKLINNQLTIWQGGTVTLNATMLNATATNATNSDVIFTLSDLYNGYFNKTGLPNMVYNFSQQDINAGDITFTHSGTPIAPSYKTRVTAGNCETASEQSNIQQRPHYKLSH